MPMDCAAGTVWYCIDWKESHNIGGALAETACRMNGNSATPPLREKVSLFRHDDFATGPAKVLDEKTMPNRIDMFREHILWGNHLHRVTI